MSDGGKGDARCPGQGYEQGWDRIFGNRRTAAEASDESASHCCFRCHEKSGRMWLDRMILCPECGNKRCPKATDHELACTNSNDFGQPGSIYGGVGEITKP